MFGFSFWKIVVLLLVILVVFFGYRLLEKQLGGTIPKLGARKTGPSARARPEPAAARTTDLVHCKTCDSFVPGDQHACGRPRCPYPA